jgi:fructokinase
MSGLRKPFVVCLGEMLWDCLADQPDRGEAEVTSWTEYPGGAPANAACALVRLGTGAAFVGCLGEDTAGDGLIATLRLGGVDIRGVQRHSLPSRKIYVTRTSLGERHFASFGGKSRDGFADTRLAAELLPEELFVERSFLLIGSLMAAFPASAAAVERALDLADAHFVKVFFDVNWRPVFWASEATARAVVHRLITRSDVLKLSAEEAEWLELPTVEAIRERFDHLEGVFLTRGPEGCSWWLAGECGEHPGFRVSAIDTTGAGDTFSAALLHQLCRHRLVDWGRIAAAAVEYASAAGALSTLRPGAIAAAPKDGEVRAFLAQDAAGSAILQTLGADG